MRNKDGNHHKHQATEATKQSRRSNNHINRNQPSKNRENSNRVRDDKHNPPKKHNKSRTKKVQYEPHAPRSKCTQRYALQDPTLIRGKLRVLPSKNGAAFVTCDRGSQLHDVLIKDEKDRNRALDGDVVFVELLPPISSSSGMDDNYHHGQHEEDGGGRRVIFDADGRKTSGTLEGGAIIAECMSKLELDVSSNEEKSPKKDSREANANEGSRGCDAEDGMSNVVEYEEEEYWIEDAAGDATREGSEEEEEVEMWHDDEVQMRLWDPQVNLRKRSKKSTSSKTQQQQQCNGKVIHILPPKSSVGQQPSEFNPEEEESYRNQLPKRTIVGTLTRLPGQWGGGEASKNKKGGALGSVRYLLVPTNKSLPRFMCPPGTKEENNEHSTNNHESGNAVEDVANHNNGNEPSKMLYRAEYVHGSWHSSNKWPPCTNVSCLCGTHNVHDEIKALLVENNVDHGEFPSMVLRDVAESVKSGRIILDKCDGDENEMGWKPTETMCRGRRDYRKHRVFTIDPTTAKDLDDALHITQLEDGRVEIGVHIADVSHFISPGSAVDEEALRRATSVYLVNGVIPMLPRPLCEIACSLNENVERLAFSCVWRMNMDGTLGKKKMGGKNKGQQHTNEDDIWYGRTVIKSCARLDYATAQNIIDKKVANGEPHVDATYWPKSRQPTGGHTIDQVAADVRLMHKVAMARRKLRFENGALALNGIKLAFQLEEDGETPKLCAPYPIRDSNRLIEEFMLLANYLVAQRLITHAHGRALLRNHAPPIEQGMQQVVDVSKESFNFEIDTTNSNTLQESLSRLSRECNDELVVQCVTESLMTPMRPAEYIAAGELDEVDWQHFALNIPYYTHFTSPIRRYPDVIVHRLLQATLDEEVENFSLTQKEIHSAALHCNDMRMSAKKAQERSDRVFLSLYLKKNPISSTLGVCLGVGEKTFTVFVPSLGLSTRCFLQEHDNEFDIHAFEDSNNGKRRIVIRPKTSIVPGMEAQPSHEGSWKSLDIQVFTKLEVECTCKMQTPIDVRVKVVGPWK